VLTAAAWAAVEVRALRRLARVDQARARLLAGPDDSAAETDRLIGELRIALGRRPSLAPALRRYDGEVTDTHEPPQRLALFVRDVLAVADGEAYRAVGRASRDVAVLTAIVPTAVADA